jgi:hypothetical protein
MKRKLLYTAFCLFIFAGRAITADFSDKLYPGCMISIKTPDTYAVRTMLKGPTFTVYECQGPVKDIFLNITITYDKQNISTALFLKNERNHAEKEYGAVASENKIYFNEIKEGSAVVGMYYALQFKKPDAENMRYMFSGIIIKKGIGIDFRNFSSSKIDNIEEYLSIVRSISFTAYNVKQYSIDDVTLSKNDAEKNVSIGKDIMFTTEEVGQYYADPSEFAFSLPVPAAKDVQSFSSGSDRGSVMYFQYDSIIEEYSILFRSIFSKREEPSERHPEEYIIEGNMLIILCFDVKSKLKEDVKKVILNKLKNKKN